MKGQAPFARGEAEEHLSRLPGWILGPAAQSIRREFVMKDFMAAIRLIDQIAQAAEHDDHHPDLHLTGYRRLAIEIATHSIGGLSEKDFVLAARIDGLPKDMKR